MSVDRFYTGSQGAHYHRNRANARSAGNQELRAARFADLASQDNVILDFGCGTGGLLSKLPARIRIGIEINPVAAVEARERLDEVFESLAEVPEGSVDTIVTNHALEHVASPEATLRELYSKLKPGGLIRVIVPCEQPRLQPQQREWRSEDPDMHLYSWTPLTLGNLLTVAGFQVVDSGTFPDSIGGRLGRRFPYGSRPQRFLGWLVSQRNGYFHTAVTARRLSDG